jgi:hypothetical protein
MRTVKRISFALSTVGVGLLLILSTIAPVSAQSKKPLTSDDLIQMKKANFDDQMVVNAIAADGVLVDTSVQGLMVLKSAGMSDKVINAVLSAATPRTSAPSAIEEQNKSVPEEIGAYVMVKDSLMALPVEIVNVKTAGMLGTIMTYGLKKAKVQGTVNGSKSSTQLTTPVTLVLRCPDGTAPTEYQLVLLDAKKGSREFTEAKTGITGESGGVNKEAIAIKFDKIGRNTYKATLSDLRNGEYGILAPGALASANGASSGKLYTFGVIE